MRVNGLFEIIEEWNTSKDQAGKFQKQAIKGYKLMNIIA